MYFIVNMDTCNVNQPQQRCQKGYELNSLSKLSMDLPELNDSLDDIHEMEVEQQGNNNDRSKMARSLHLKTLCKPAEATLIPLGKAIC